MKGILLAPALLLLILLISCGQPPTNAVANPEVSNAATQTDTIAQDAGEIVPNSAANSIPEEQGEEVDLEKIGWAMMKNERFGRIGLKMDAATVLSMMGEPASRSEPEYWGADGRYHSDWQYDMEGIILGMVQEEENLGSGDTLRVERITVLGHSTLRTQRGIGIGSSINEVMAAYPEVPEDGAAAEGWLVAGTVYGGLMFGMEAGVVIEMFLGAAAE